MSTQRGAQVSVLVLAAVAVSCAASGKERAVRPGEPPNINDVSWDPTTGIVGCAAGSVELTVPRQWKDRVAAIAHDLVIVVPHPAAGALLVTVSPAFLRGKRAGVLGDLPEIWKELHKQATGVDLRDGDLQGTFRAAGGRVVVEYAYDPPVTEIHYEPSARPDFEDDHPPAPPPFAYDLERKTQWRLVYVAAGRCRVAAVDRTGPDDRPRLAPLLDEMRIAAGLIPL